MKQEKKITKKRAKSPVQAQATSVYAERQQRIQNCGKWLVISPLELKSLISQFTEGEFDNCGKSVVSILENDAQIKTCLNKRYEMLSSSRWDVVANESGESGEEVKEQTEVVRDFFNTIFVNSSEALDARGGFSDLLRSMMRALVYGYDASAVTFVPSRTPSGKPTYHAKITTNPIYLFEARARKLRIRIDREQIGRELSGDWVIAHYSNPIAPALLTLHFFKAIAEVDWSSVCEKFGTPFVIVKTSAQSGTTEWQQAQDLAASVGANFNAVVGNDVELQVEKLAQGTAPHKELVDYFDRAIARLVLGGDLDTMSQRGDNTGSGAQQKREDFMRQSDKSWAESVIDNYLTRPLLEKVFPGKKPLVYLSLSAQSERNIEQVLNVIKISSMVGLPVSKTWLYENLGMPVPTEKGDEVIPAMSTYSEVGDAVNSAREKSSPIKRLFSARQEQYEPFLEQIRAIKNAKDDKEAFLLATKLNQTFPSAAQRVLANTKFASVLSEEVMKNAQDPIDEFNGGKENVD